ncbi:unnamed protein product [Protopolystoma xenopodis]|uniref:Uncharacterized protein n=1 Tax=Protopolystoma xenopodis TaxID=117903 RepID=A0A3S5CM03_9PLAT|nr:unnamed protein product [Protopolystoma xenopodis]
MHAKEARAEETVTGMFSKVSRDDCDKLHNPAHAESTRNRGHTTDHVIILGFTPSLQLGHSFLLKYADLIEPSSDTHF